MGKNLKKHRRVIASLEYGIIYSKCFIGFVYFIISLCVAGVGITLYGTISDKEYYALIALPFFFFGFAMAIYFISFNRRQISYIKPFLDDAIELTAKTIILDRFITLGLLRIPIAKIAVIFTYDGREIVRQSGRKNLEKSSAKNYKTGYNAIFYKYANREIQILYSPKYDQVLILKNKKPKNKN